MSSTYALTRAEYEAEVDVTIAASFPASDPPSWTFGASPWMETPVAARPVPAAIDVVLRDGPRFGGIRISGLGEALALTALVPFGILVAGLPVMALFWGISMLIARLTGN